MSDGVGKTFLDTVCTQLYRVQLVFLVALTFFVFSIVALFVVEPGTPAYVVNWINIVTLGVFVAVFGSMTYLCNNR